MAGLSSKDLAKIAETLKKESPKLFEEVFQNRTNPDAKKIMKEKWDQVSKALGKGGMNTDDIDISGDAKSSSDFEMSPDTKKKVKWILIAVLAILLVQIVIVILAFLPKL
jgi:hypothetical protein